MRSVIAAGMAGPSEGCTLAFSVADAAVAAAAGVAVRTGALSPLRGRSQTWPR